MTSPWVRGSLVRNRGGRGAGSSSFVESGPIAPNIALLTPHTDNTISLTDRGTDAVTVTTTRATTGWIQQYDGTWTLVGAGVPRIMGARYSAGTYYYTDGSGNELRPTRTVTVGGYSWKHFDSYRPWPQNTAVILGERIAVTIDGLGYYATCSTAGTTNNSAEPTWSVSTGITDGTAEWDITATSYYRIEGLMVEEAMTNRCLYSQTFGDAGWVSGGGGISVTTDNTTAPDGTTTADLLTASGANGTLIRDLGTVASAAKFGAIFLKRKTGTGNIDLTLDGGSTWTTVAVTTSWKRLSITQTLADEDFGVRIVTSGDEVWAWQADVATASAVSATPGLATTAAAATRNADAISFSEPSWFDTGATVLSDFAFRELATRAVLSSVLSHSTTAFLSFDGTTVETMPSTNLSGRGGLRFSGSDRQLSLLGTNDTPVGAYDGNWGTTTLSLGNSGAGTSYYNGTLLNVILLQTDIGATDLATATARDAA